MKLKNILLVVKDIEKSKQFYHDLFGLDMILDNDGNIIEQGNHEELLEKKGFYYNLYNSQFAV